MNNSATEITNEKLENKELENKGNEAVVSTETNTVNSESKEKEESNESSSTVVSETNEKENNENKKIMKYIDDDFCYDLMSVPTVSDEEYRLVTYIILWARRNNIEYEFDEKGNIYLTKGELAEGEYYPCVTAHLDTVQTKQKPYAQAGCRLEVKTRVVSGHHEIYVDGMGIGGDDKAGVVICLSMFSHFDKLKAAFFLCEERGCIGSNSMDVSKLDNVGYVMGFDSPELNRAAHTCSGFRLFSKQFFETYLRDICKEHGLTDFRSEPYTDVKVIRDKTDIMCMNFGTGYYFCHMPNEYCVLEEMDNACKMGVALIKKIGNTRHEYSYKSGSTTWVKQADGTYKAPENEDEEFFRNLSPRTSYSGYYTGSGYWNGNTYGKSSTTVATTTKTTTNSITYTNHAQEQSSKKDDDSVSFETLSYIIENYDDYVNEIKEKIEDKCKSLNIDFDNFKEFFDKKIKF